MSHDVIPQPVDEPGAGQRDSPELTLVGAATARELASDYGIAHPAQLVVDSTQAAVTAAESLGFPVVLKALGPSVIHKSDVGGVRLGLMSGEEVAAASEDVLGSVAGTDELLVQQMVRPGLVEMIVGAKQDPVFGPVVVVGVGGLWAEVLHDVALGLAPVSMDRAHEMLRSLKFFSVLAGARGKSGIELDALASLVVAVGKIAHDRPDLVEIDLNPVVCDDAGAVAVDLRFLQGAVRTRLETRDRSDAVSAIFAPRGIAVVGASRDENKQGSRLLANLLRHGREDVVVIHPSATELQGQPVATGFDQLKEVPELACLAVPSSRVQDALEQCVAAGVRAAVLFGSGFAETGDASDAEREQTLTDLLERTDIAICGPNTAGVASAVNDLCASMGTAFSIGDGHLPVGTTALITQSGAIGGSLLSRLRQSGVGFSHWVATGNETDLTMSDYLSWLAKDSATETIVLFIEAIRDGEAFARACEEARANGKHILAFKTGSSVAGQAAVRSHTAALAGDEAVYEAAFNEFGVAQTSSMQALIDAAQLIDWQPLPAGSRVGVVSGSGGACSVVADECEVAGLELPPLRGKTKARVIEAIPPFGRAENPVDVTMQINVRPQMVGEVVQAMLDDDDFDSVLLMMTSNADPPAIEVARGVIEAARGSVKPVIVARMGAEELAPESLKMYEDARIPVVPMSDRAVASLAIASRLARRRTTSRSDFEDLERREEVDA